MTSFLNRLNRAIEAVAGLLLGAVTILIVVSAVGRYGFASPIPDAFDISRLLVGACITWGFAAVGYRGGHISVDLVTAALPPVLRRWVEVVAWSILLLFVVLVAWKMLGRVESAQRSAESTFDLRLRVWPLLGLIWLGVLASVATVATRIWLLATGRITDPDGSPDPATESPHDREEITHGGE